MARPVSLPPLRRVLLLLATLVVCGLTPPGALHGQTGVSFSAWSSGSSGHAFDGASFGLAHQSPATGLFADLAFSTGIPAQAIPVTSYSHRTLPRGKRFRDIHIYDPAIYCWDPWDPWYGYRPWCDGYQWAHAWVPVRAFPVGPAYAWAPPRYRSSGFAFGFTWSSGWGSGWHAGWNSGWVDPWWGPPPVRWARSHRVRVHPVHRWPSHSTFVYAPTTIYVNSPAVGVHRPQYVVRGAGLGLQPAPRFKEEPGLSSANRTAVRRSVGAAAPTPARAAASRSSGSVAQGEATPQARAGAAPSRTQSAPARSGVATSRAEPSPSRAGFAPSPDLRTRGGAASSARNTTDARSSTGSRVAPSPTQQNRPTPSARTTSPSATSSRAAPSGNAPARTSPTPSSRTAPPAPSSRAAPGASDARSPASVPGPRATPSARTGSSPSSRATPAPAPQTRSQPQTRQQPQTRAQPQQRSASPPRPRP